MEIDDHSHGPLAERMTHVLYQGDPQKEQAGAQAAIKALRLRRRLWDGALAAMFLERTALTT